MKKIFLALLIIIMSQNVLHAKKLTGYIIYHSKDTIKVTLNIPFKVIPNEPDFIKLQSEIKYFDSLNHKQFLIPEMAREILFEYEGNKVRMLSHIIKLESTESNNLVNSYLFLHLIKEGKMKLFKYYTTNVSVYDSPNSISPGVSTNTVSQFVMQKNNDQLFTFGLFSFKKDMINYLSDCPLLAKKIEEKTYRKEDIEQIVDDYNYSCK